MQLAKKMPIVLTVASQLIRETPRERVCGFDTTKRSLMSND
jgi:hypothetical protein